MTEWPQILIVEDEGVVAKDLQVCLERLGYGVAGWVTSGEEAVTRAAATRPDLVLMDIRLRGEIDGIEAADRIRRDHDIPVVFLTAYADKDTLNRAMIAEPFGYVAKPFSERELHSSIEVALYKHAAERRVAELVEKLEQGNRELARERQLLSALFEHSPCPVMVLDADLRVRRVNRNFSASFKIDAIRPTKTLGLGDVLSCPFRNPETGACGATEECRTCRLVEAIRDVFSGSSIYRLRAEIESERASRHQTRTMLVSASSILHEEDPFAIVVLEDVTELTTLRRLVGTDASFAGIVGSHPTMLEVFDTIRDIADVAVPVMVLGESGTGKELVARAIHTMGARQHANFVPVNCAALPESLLETELFGHVKGAFTGASRDRKGRFELADGGTIFLDEIGDLSAQTQVKLLRVLQEGTFERVGGEKTIEVNARVVCATNRDLDAEIRAGRFREDLFYRLCVVPIRMPPLRDRLSDLLPLAVHILERVASSGARSRPELSSEVLEVLSGHAWPGNVRELQNVLQYAMVKCKGDRIMPEHLPPSIRGHEVRPAATTGRRTAKMTRESVRRALAQCDGNRTRAAKALGVSRATLYRFLSEHPSLAAEA